MEEFYINITSKDQMPDYNISSENISSTNDTDYSYDEITGISFFISVLQWLIVGIGIPLTLMAIFALCSLIKEDRSVPVFVINLLVSDLIQLCCQTAWNLGATHTIIYIIYIFGLMASVGFMVCISLERYLVIAHPLWYRFRRTLKTSVVACVVVWTLPLVYVLPGFLKINFEVTTTIFGIFLLLPLPLFIFFLVGTLRALSGAHSVPADEKRRIVAILVLVLLIYTLLFMPTIVWFLVENYQDNDILDVLSFILVSASPLADVIMYILIRKGDTNQLLASLRCC